MSEKKEEKPVAKGRRTFLATAVGTIVGAIVTGVGVWALTPKGVVEVPKEVIKEVTTTITAPGATVTAPGVTKTVTAAAVTTTVTAPAVTKEVTVTATAVPGAPALRPGAGITPDEIALNAMKVMAVEGKIPAGTKITFLIAAGTIDQLSWLEPMMKDYLGVTLDYVAVDWADLGKRAIEEMVTKTGKYDLLIVADEWVADLVEGGLYKDITSWIEKYKPELYEWPCPFSWQYQKCDRYLGKDYQWIWDGCLWQPYYRWDLLTNPDEQRAFESEYGYEIPDVTKPGMTWDQWYDLVKFFDRPDMVQTLPDGSTLKGLRGSWFYLTRSEIGTMWYIILLSKGGLPFDDNMNATPDSAEGVAALEFMKKVSAHVPEICITGTWSEEYADYPAGKTATGYAWTSLAKFSVLGAIKGQNMIGVVPGDVVKGKHLGTTTRYETAAIAVSNYSKNPELAYLFMQYIESPRISAECISRVGYWDPSRECHYTYPPILKVYGGTTEMGLRVLHSNYENTKRDSPHMQIVRFGEYIDAINANCHAYITGATGTAKDALTAVRDSWNKTTDEVGRDGQLTRWNALKPYFSPPICAIHGWPSDRPWTD